MVEDARIERKIKNKFPGGRRAFVEGYNDLMKRDFFGIKERDITELGLIDKINLHYKVGDHLNLSFSDEESVFVDRIDKAETWKEVVKICEDLYDYAKENESETDMSDHDYGCMPDDDEEDWDEDYDPSDYEEMESPVDSCDEGDTGDAGEETGEEESDGPGDNDTTGGNASDEKSSEEENSEGSAKSKEGDSDKEDESKKGSPSSGMEGGTDGSFSDYEPESKTDTNFRNNESELVSDEAKLYRYLNIPTNIDLKDVIVIFLIS